MKKIKLIAVDLDGTLLDDAKGLPDVNREALQEAASRGIIIVIASGRMTPRIEPIEDLLGIDCVLIAYNGGKVLAPRREGRATILHKPLPAPVAEIFIRYSQEKGYLLNFYHDERLYAEDGPSRRPFMDLYTSRTGAPFHVEKDLKRFIGVSPTKLILLASPEETDRLRVEFSEKLKSLAFITKSEPEYLEIMAPGVNKGSAVKFIAGHYGLGMDEVLALGDADNDMCMLAAAGWGVAVANAAPHVRKAARAVTDRTNNEGGVAEALRRWVLSG